MHLVLNDPVFDNLDPHDLVAQSDLALGSFAWISELGKTRSLNDAKAEVAKELLLCQAKLLIDLLNLRLILSERTKGF